MNRKLKARCLEETDRILSLNIAKIFSRPVDPDLDGLPDYFEVVNKPMDLATVRRNLIADKYKTVEEWKNDVDLVWGNCYLYNGDDSLASILARDLQSRFNENIIGLSDDSRAAWIEKFKVLKGRVDRITASHPDLRQPIPILGDELSMFITPEEQAIVDAEEEYMRKLRERQRREEICAREKARIQQKEREREQIRKEYAEKKKKEYEFERRRRSVSRPRISEDDLSGVIDFINSIDNEDDFEEITQIIAKYESGGEMQMDVEQFKNETLYALNKYVKSQTR